MARTIVLLTLASLARYDEGDALKAVTAVRAAYMANLAALSSSGAIRFDSFDGNVGPAPGVDAIAALVNGKWKRRSRSQGVYFFDGENRRYDNLYPPEELVARRTKTSPNSWESLIGSERLLTDGDSTLMDTVNVDADDVTVLHSPNIRAGPQHFFRIAEGIPLRLGDPDPLDYDLGNCLTKVLEGRGEGVLVSVGKAELLDGVAIVKLRVDLPATPDKLQVTFWIDLEHGAIPVRSQILGWIAHTGKAAVLQFNNYDIKWVGRGWLPSRWTVAQGSVSANGEVPAMLVREFTIDGTDFAKRPDRAVFSMQFPKAYRTSDSDRRVSFGSRQVWEL
jgi:hypothetical protein